MSISPATNLLEFVKVHLQAIECQQFIGGEGRNRAAHARFLMKNIRLFPRNCKYFVTAWANPFFTPLLKVLLKLLLKISELTAFATRARL